MSNPTNHTAERRALPRRPCDGFSCRLLEEMPRGVEPRDFSPEGIGLLCESPVEEGELLSLHLSRPGNPLGLGLRARVIHAKERPDGRWVAGCAFDNNLPDALVALLV
jgi:hypothetical protein